MLSKQLSGMQVVENISQSTIIPNPHNPTSSADNDSELGIVLFLKIVFYFIFVAKIIEISFLRRRRYSLKERVYRKFLFAHQEILKYFTDEDKSIMESTLNNTIKNASMEFDPKKTKIRRGNKRVIFQVSRNTYYDARDWRQQQMRISLLREKVERLRETGTSTFIEQKIQDQLVEREDLLGLSQRQDEVLPQQSIVMDEQQQSLNRQQVLSSNIINNCINF